MPLRGSPLQAMKHTISRLQLRALAPISVTSLLHQHFVLPHGTNIPLVGWWHAYVARSSYVPVNKKMKFQPNLPLPRALSRKCTWSDTRRANSKRSLSLNSKLSCTKNNTQRQLVEMIAWLGLNDKFPHNQTLTGCTLKPHISKQEKPDHLWALMFCNHLWCTPPKDKTGSIAQLSVNTCKMYTTELIVLDNLFNCSLLNRFRYSLSKYLIR